MTELLAFALHGLAPKIVPAPVERPWMDATGDRFAYRCLPLNIANAHGWELLCPAAFSAIWDGGPHPGAVRIIDGAEANCALGHFGSGVLTFHIPYLFRTDPGFDLYVGGPTNRPKDAIAPLTGIVESDWSPYTFTMNWIFTRPDTLVRFEADEPFACIFPVRRGALESVRPEIRDIASEPDLARQHAEWSAGRSEFNQKLVAHDPEAARQAWQKTYFQGNRPDGSSGPSDHRSRLRLAPFSDDRALKDPP